MIHIPHPVKNGLWTMILSTIFILPAIAQKQPGIPQPRGPVDLSDTSNLVIFIVLPILVIIFFFFWRKAMKKRKAEAEEEENEKKRRQ